MDVTAKEAFRLGFLSRCAEEGLTGEHLSARIKSAAEKQSFLPMIPLALGVLGTAGLGYGLVRGGVDGVVDNASAMAGLIPAGGLLAGAGLGYGAAKMTEPNITDEDIKSQELADTYRIYAEKAKANRRARQYRVSRQ
jgi:hypothetical protein